MNRSLLLGSIAGALLLALLWFQPGSGKNVVTSHAENLALFSEAGQIEATLQKDVLRGMSFMLPNYDGFVALNNQFASVCARMKDSKGNLYGQVSLSLDQAIDNFCSEIANQMEMIETFKSKNAILRNSVLFLQKSEIEYSAPGRPATISEQEDEMITFSILYIMADSPESKASLEAALFQTPPKYFKKEFQERFKEIQTHAKIVLEAETELNEISEVLVNPKVEEQLAEIRNRYFQNYGQELKNAQSSRWLLTILCFVLVLIVAYSSLLVWRTSRALRFANSNLESRVIERTKELELSNQVIRDQQSVLISSAKSSALGEMAGQIAHEINTPLGAIVLTVQGLNKKVKAGVVKPGEISTKLEFVLLITSKLSRIIGSMRKMAGHGASEQISDVLIQELVEDTLLLCEGRFKKTGISFEFKNLLPAETRLQCRPNEIAQVLVNLLNNAHDATAGLAEKWVRLETAQTGKFLNIRVIDSGRGLAPENVSKLFTPNFTTKSLDSGTGFGLSICRKIAERHKGRIYLDTKSLTTTFTLEIPFEQIETLATAVGA